MIEGICPKCGRHYYGWGLKIPRNQMCEDCGVGLEIFEEGQQTYRGYSPFTAEKYVLRTDLPVDDEQKVKETE